MIVREVCFFFVLDKFRIIKNVGFSIYKCTRSWIPLLVKSFSDKLRSYNEDFFKYLSNKVLHWYPKLLLEISN